MRGVAKTDRTHDLFSENDAKGARRTPATIVALLLAESLELNRPQQVRATTVLQIEWLDRQRLRYLRSSCTEMTEFLDQHLTGEGPLIGEAEQLPRVPPPASRLRVPAGNERRSRYPHP